MLSVEEEQQLEKKRQGEGCEMEEQKRLKLGEAMDEDTDKDEDGDMDMKFNQAEAKMSSVEGGRPSEGEEEEELEKNPQGQGCELEDPKKKPQGEGQGCESEEEYEYEDSSEEEYEDPSEEEEEVVFENEVVVSLDDDDDDDEDEEVVSLADDDLDFRDAYPKDRNVLFESAMNKPYMIGLTTFERGNGIDEPIPDDFPKRRCDRFVRCNVSDHDVFVGSPIFDLFRVEFYLKNPQSKPLSGKIYGAIELKATPDNPHPISYFFVKKEDAIPFTLDPDREYGTFSLPLSGPKTRPPLVKNYWFDLKFAVKIAFEGNDVVEQYKDVFERMGCAHDNAELFDHTVYAAVISLYPNSVGYFQRSISVQMKFLPYREEDDIGMAAFHSAYNGSCATVGVEIKKKGLSGFYGFIFARPCLLPNSRMYLLSIDKNQMRELKSSESLHLVKLTRKVASAPTCSSLIIVAELWDQDGESIVKGKTSFSAKPEGTFGRFIGEKGVGIDVKVKWKCYQTSSQLSLIHEDSYQ